MSIKNFKPSKKSNFKQGYYRLKNPEKYLGDKGNIIYRSSWERKFCIYCDTNPKIIKWSSEPVKITYLNENDNETHRYFPDFYIKVDQGNRVEQYIVEIKPYKYSKKPELPQRKTKKQMKNYYHTLEQYNKNKSKWKAAKRACDNNGYKFIVLTEKFLEKV